jgi:hypothetical protein
MSSHSVHNINRVKYKGGIIRHKLDDDLGVRRARPATALSWASKYTYGGLRSACNLPASVRPKKAMHKKKHIDASRV